MIDNFTIEELTLSDGTDIEGVFAVTHFEDVEGSFMFDAASDLDYRGYTDIDWEWVSFTSYDEDGEVITNGIGEPTFYKGDRDDYIAEKLTDLMREQTVNYDCDYSIDYYNNQLALGY